MIYKILYKLYFVIGPFLVRFKNEKRTRKKTNNFGSVYDVIYDIGLL